MPLLDKDANPNYNDLYFYEQTDASGKRFLDEGAKKYFNMSATDLIVKMGYDAAAKTIEDLNRGRGKGGSGDAWDDTTKYSDPDAANRLFQKQMMDRAERAQRKAEAEESRRLKASLTREMKYGSFAMPFDVTKHINAVVSAKGNMDMLLNRIFADKRFKKAFPGILDSHGDLKMSVSEYNGRRDEAKASFARAGFKLSDADFGVLAQKNVSPNEAQERAQIAGFIRGNADLLVAVKSQVAQMNAERKAKGLPPLQGLNTMADIKKYVTKQGSSELYSTYEGGVLAAAAKRAGLDVTAARARELAGKGTDITSMEEAGAKYKNIADRIRMAGVELDAFGIGQKELEVIEFGGAGQAELAAKAEQSLRNFEKQSETALSGAEAQVKGGRVISGQGKEGAL